MIKKLTFSIIGLIFLGFAIITPCSQGEDTCNENSDKKAAENKFKDLGCAQVAYMPTHGERTYPFIGQGVKWNSSSIVGSTADLENVLGVELSMTSVSEKGGDIRFRCRSQNGTLYCFAFRCKEKEPAGCDQFLWRMHAQLDCRSGQLCEPSVTSKVLGFYRTEGCMSVSTNVTCP
ncbi:MAG: hypothetical protein WCX16_00955 [Candidatus Omnitrophota bacterium]|jgi:hypothetical protein